jgi:hypothetical protein
MSPSFASDRGICGSEPLQDHLVISGEILQCIGKPAAATQGTNRCRLIRDFDGDEPAALANPS